MTELKGNNNQKCRRNLWDLGLSKEFLDLTQKNHNPQKEKMINQTSSKLKNFVL